MDAITLLQKDHKKVKDLFKKIYHTTIKTLKRREQLYKHIIKELKIHTKIEEKIFYPSLKNSAKTKKLILESFEEHKLVDQIIVDIKKLNYDDDRWMPRLKVLKENVLHHIKEEEGDLFPKVKKLYNKNDLKLLGTEMKQLKDNLQSVFIPNALANVFVNHKFEKKHKKSK